MFFVAFSARFGKIFSSRLWLWALPEWERRGACSDRTKAEAAIASRMRTFLPGRLRVVHFRGGKAAVSRNLGAPIASRFREALPHLKDPSLALIGLWLQLQKTTGAFLFCSKVDAVCRRQNTFNTSSSIPFTSARQDVTLHELTNSPLCRSECLVGGHQRSSAVMTKCRRAAQDQVNMRDTHAKCSQCFVWHFKSTPFSCHAFTEPELS